jgi:hypothetical protein
MTDEQQPIQQQQSDHRRAPPTRADEPVNAARADDPFLAMKQMQQQPIRNA